MIGIGIGMLQRTMRTPCHAISLKELGHHISDHDAINSTAILFLPYKEAISLDYCQFTGLWVQ